MMILMIQIILLPSIGVCVFSIKSYFRINDYTNSGKSGWKENVRNIIFLMGKEKKKLKFPLVFGEMVDNDWSKIW